MGMNIEKARLYKTAKATIACYGVEVGDVVSIANPERGPDGKVWFDITATEKLSAEEMKRRGTIRYHEGHLTNFVL